MKKQQFFMAVAVVVSMLFILPASAQVILLQEDFEGLELGPFVNESFSAPPTLDTSKVWTNVPPEGWVIEDIAPGGGQ